MDTQHILSEIAAVVEGRLCKEGTGHDWWHIVRVRNTAKTLLHCEPDADDFVVEAAVLLHDVGDRKVLGTKNDDYTIAAGILKNLAVQQKYVENIMYIVKHMSFSASLDHTKEVESIEFCIVQDADRLDAMGAIGIARTFAYGGAQGRLLYNPQVPAAQPETAASYKTSKSSSLQHFTDKLFTLKDTMRTKEGRRLAQKRHEYMQKYYDTFLEEWRGVE